MSLRDIKLLRSAGWDNNQRTAYRVSKSDVTAVLQHTKSRLIVVSTQYK
jgi:hypothetical protein